MAEQTQTRTQDQAQESNGGHKGAIQMAAIAAATGAAALAAKKAFSGKEQSGGGTQRSGGGGDESMLVAMAGSGWAAARNSLQPFAEEAAGAAGEWVGRNGPDYVRDTIVTQFIRGFESARSSQSE